MTAPNGIGQFIIGVSQIGQPPGFDFKTTFISQYANSPRIFSMAESFSEAIDLTGIVQNFLDSIWDIDTAEDYGLDLWGRIVGVSRVIPVRQGQFFGFHEAGDLNGGNFGSNDPFYQGQSLTNNYYLSNSAFKTLIYAKALANISDASIPSINSILNLLFPNRGKAYVLDNQDMTMNYVFDFPLTPVEESIVYNAGVLPRPSGVLLNLQLLVLFDFLFPNQYPSPGLLQAHFDGLGNGVFESTVGGSTPAYTTTTTGNQITIPYANGGTQVTWIRGVWLAAVTMSWNGYMADLTASQSLPAAQNYLANKQTDINHWSYGAGAEFDITASAGVITVATPSTGKNGSGYAVGNIVPFNGGDNNAHATVATIDANGGILTVNTIVGGTNYVTATNVTTNLAVNTKTATIITLPQSIADATSVQVFYSYKNGSPTLKGEALSGWPQLHSSISGQDYGTANDGDNYIAHALYYASAVTSNAKYKNVANRILAAQMEYGYGLGQSFAFDMPLAAEQNTGMYYYANSPATWTWNVDPLPDGSGLNGLHVQTTVGAGAAGWGTWPVWAITALSPVSSISFDFWGDGSNNSIQLTTNIHNPADGAGKFVYGFPCLTINSGTKRTFTVGMADLWQVQNIVLNTDRTNSYTGVTSDGTVPATIANQVEDNTGPSGYHRFLAKRFTYSMQSGGGTYAEAWAGTGNASFSSTGTDRLKIDLNCSAAVSILITIKDAVSASFTYTYAAAAGAQVFSVLYSAFTPSTGITHPIKEVHFKISTVANGYVDIDNIRCSTATSDIVTMANVSPAPTMLNGLEFDFVSGSYNVYWKNLTINQTPINPYPGISRWTYNFAQFGSVYGAGPWRGPQAPGYMWMGAYALSGIQHPTGTLATYPDGTSADLSNQPVIETMRKFMQDSQNAYKAQYPAQTIGPFMKKYGTWSWEQVQGVGYIGGVAVPNGTYPNGVLNEWFCEGTDDWYGYQYRAMLSVAEDYYYTGNAVSLSVLNNIIAWMAAKCTWNGTNHSVTCPTTFNIDGTLANSSNIYADAVLAQICIYKYWRDGDATAFTWYSHFMDDLHYNHKITNLGDIALGYVRNGGQNYSYATGTIVDPTGAGLTAKVIVAGGKVSHVEIAGTMTTPYTNPTLTIAGDGTGAAVVLVLSDQLYGAYAYQHAGWEVAEIGKLLGMLLHGRPGGAVNNTLAAPSYTQTDYNDLWNFYLNNTTDLRPSIRNQKGIPMHEFTLSSWHWYNGLENPVNADTTMSGSRDTHTDGDIWTETIGPSLFFAADRYQATGDATWLDYLYELVSAMSGLTTYQ